MASLSFRRMQHPVMIVIIKFAAGLGLGSADAPSFLGTAPI